MTQTHMKMHSIGKIIMLTKKVLKTFCVCLMLGMYFGNDVSSTKLMLLPNRCDIMSIRRSC